MTCPNCGEKAATHTSAQTGIFLCGNCDKYYTKSGKYADTTEELKRK